MHKSTWYIVISLLSLLTFIIGLIGYLILVRQKYIEYLTVCQLASKVELELDNCHPSFEQFSLNPLQYWNKSSKISMDAKSKWQIQKQQKIEDITTLIANSKNVYNIDTTQAEADLEKINTTINIKDGFEAIDNLNDSLTKQINKMNIEQQRNLGILLTQAQNLYKLLPGNDGLKTIVTSLQTEYRQNNTKSVEAFEVRNQLINSSNSSLTNLVSTNFTGVDIGVFLQTKAFLDQDYQSFFQNLDLRKIDSNLTNSGNKIVVFTPDVDDYIRKLAISRGYKFQLEVSDESKLADIEDFKLNPDAAENYSKMLAAAKNDGVNFKISSGFRDQSLQKEFFLNEFQSVSSNIYGTIFNNNDILSGRADEALDKTISRVAFPGFSKHQTGHAIDLNSSDVNIKGKPFDQTPAFNWLSKNNYFNAKKFGFIPSYPEVKIDTKLGPNPESWEYFYVGNEAVSLTK